MRRGELGTVAGGKGYTGKPRPVVIVQDDSFDATDSITVCAFTTDKTDAPLYRLPVEPTERNGLHAACRLMVDKISTVPKTKLGTHVGRLEYEDILRLNRAVVVFLGPASSLAKGEQGGVSIRARTSRVQRGARTPISRIKDCYEDPLMNGKSGSNRASLRSVEKHIRRG